MYVSYICVCPQNSMGTSDRKTRGNKKTGTDMKAKERFVPGLILLADKLFALHLLWGLLLWQLLLCHFLSHLVLCRLRLRLCLPFGLRPCLRSRLRRRILLLLRLSRLAQLTLVCISQRDEVVRSSLLAGSCSTLCCISKSQKAARVKTLDGIASTRIRGYIEKDSHIDNYTTTLNIFATC